MTYNPTLTEAAKQKILAAGQITEAILEATLRNIADPEDQQAFLEELAAKYTLSDTQDEATRIFREDWYGNTLGLLSHEIEALSRGEQPSSEKAMAQLNNPDLLLPRNYYAEPKRLAAMQQELGSAATFESFFPSEVEAYANELVERFKTEVLKGRTVEELQAANLELEIALLKDMIAEMNRIQHIDHIKEMSDPSEIEPPHVERMEGRRRLA